MSVLAPASLQLQLRHTVLSLVVSSITCPRINRILLRNLALSLPTLGFNGYASNGFTPLDIISGIFFPCSA
ncbi:hypothetical protein GE09DRAFT_1113573 [Coniochaeta sp. 2T2.1]|nr:hypothetical protein GE09DRAFT_1113573 [Coniochaeta sp. 2T2.1]